ncbi:hypothetical protein [Dyadobacter alkalitolerans]|uniref:hypothetical protein n=1 Tax=Dyadobacter alkalitolerans TaxID=492736 RepID=UPI000412F5C3|nr:hypothetical protein [Dyadobacter alkalitolerans]
MEFPVSATSIIFVVLLIVPGVVLKRFYFQGHFTKEFGIGIFADRLITSIFLGILVQIVSFLILGKIYGFTFETIKKPASSAYQSVTTAKFQEVTSQYLWVAFGYLITSLVVAAALGQIAHMLVRTLRLDSRFSLLRFNNQWYYFFKGDIIYSKNFKSLPKGKVIETYVDIILNIEEGGKHKMVSGFLSDYAISSKTGELETIFLTDAKRFSSSKGEAIGIPGHCFIVPYNKVLDLNVRYVYREIDESKREQFILSAIQYFSSMALFLIFIFPWFLEIRGVVKFVVFFLSLITFILFIAIVRAIILPNSNGSLKGRSFWAGLFMTIAGVVILFTILDLWQILGSWAKEVIMRFNM